MLVPASIISGFWKKAIFNFTSSKHDQEYTTSTWHAVLSPLQWNYQNEDNFSDWVFILFLVSQLTRLRNWRLQQQWSRLFQVNRLVTVEVGGKIRWNVFVLLNLFLRLVTGNQGTKMNFFSSPFPLSVWLGVLFFLFHYPLVWWNRMQEFEAQLQAARSRGPGAGVALGCHGQQSGGEVEVHTTVDTCSSQSDWQRKVRWRNKVYFLVENNSTECDLKVLILSWSRRLAYLLNLAKWRKWRSLWMWTCRTSSCTPPILVTTPWRRSVSIKPRSCCGQPMQGWVFVSLPRMTCNSGEVGEMLDVEETKLFHQLDRSLCAHEVENIDAPQQ